MAVASSNQFPKVIMEEVATDGSATITPAADHRALFLGEDGNLHLKDSAAAVTNVGGLTDPMTTRGDVIVRNSSNVTARLGIGAAGKILSSDGTDVSWGNGPMTTQDDLIIGGASGVPSRLAKGTDGQVLTVDPTTHHLVWATPSAGSGDVATDTIWDAKGDLAGGTGANTAARLPVGSNGQVLTADSGETTGMKWAAAGGGGVDWSADINESGASFTNFTDFAAGTWGSNGTEITQTDTGATARRVRHNTIIPIGYPSIVEVEVNIVSVGSLGRGGILISDGSNSTGLAGIALYIQDNDNTINLERDAIALEQSASATITTATWYKLRLVLGSSFATVYLDGTLKFNAMLSSAYNVKTQYVGLYGYGASLLFRNFKAWTLSTGAPA
jgi:hypothetical protein